MNNFIFVWLLLLATAVEICICGSLGVGVCGPVEFGCDGKCITVDKLCDGHRHCTDGSDEAHCQLLHDCGGPDDFRCLNGKCISKHWVCDGHNDCSLNKDGDLSDEMFCDTTTTRLPTNYASVHCDPENGFKCLSGGPCLPLGFRCDGDTDCTDGSDEKNCPKGEMCTGKFQCQSGECIDLGMKCNGITECLDGWSDEENCAQQHECLLSEGKFLCTGGDCIHAAKVCDKTKDCHDNSDEFPDCEKSCQRSSCNQGCVPDPDPNKRGPGSGACFCYKGYEFSTRDRDNDNDNRTCVDIDECQVYGTCSQSCTNLLGSFVCSCTPAFILDERDKSSCKLKDDNASLIFALHSGIRVLNLNLADERNSVVSNNNNAKQRRKGRQERYYSLVSKLGSPVMISYDARTEWVYWTDALEQEESIWTSRLDGSERERIVSTGLSLPEGIAFDWIAKNIYYADSSLSHIVVCTANGANCSILINQQMEMDKPRDLALDPNMGLLFWTDWGITPSIMKAGMDGSNPSAIAKEDVRWPNGVTVDQNQNQGKRIYWTDAGTDKIESVNYSGGDRRVVSSKGIKHPFSVDILGDDLYWSDWNLYEIQSSNKFNGSIDTKVLVKESYEQLNGLVLYHVANQPITRRNHCRDAGCSHICTLTPAKSYKCMCPVGFHLNMRNRKICERKTNWPYFVIGWNNILKTAPMDSIGGNTFKTYILPELKQIGAIAQGPLKSTIFISDLKQRKIYLFDLITQRLRKVLGDTLHVSGMDYDEIGGNLYFVDSAKKTLEVYNLETKTRVTLFKEIHQPVDIALALNLGTIFLAESVSGTGTGVKIVRMNMDGYNRRVVQRRPNGTGTAPTLTYSRHLHRLYWTDTDEMNASVESVRVDGTSPKVTVKRAGAARGIASYKDKLYWVDAETSMIKGMDLDNGEFERGIPFGDGNTGYNNDMDKTSGDESDNASGGIFPKLEIINKEPAFVFDPSSLSKHECAVRNNKCSHMCLISSDKFKGTCVCPEHLRLDSDLKTCIELKKGEVPAQVLCTRGRCRNRNSPKSVATSATSTATAHSELIDSDSNPDSNGAGRGVDRNRMSSSSSTDSSNEDSPEEEESESVEDGDEDETKPSLELELDYDEYDESFPAFTKLLPNGSWMFPVGYAVKEESSIHENIAMKDKGKGEGERARPMTIILGVLGISVLVGLLLEILYYYIIHRRNTRSKIIVRPYIRQFPASENENTVSPNSK